MIARHLPRSGHEQIFLVLYLFGNIIGEIRISHFVRYG